MRKLNGRYIKNLREHHGYSLRKFAAMIYVSKSSLQRWEQTVFPDNTELLEKIASVLNMSVDELQAKECLFDNQDKAAETKETYGLTDEELSVLAAGTRGLSSSVALLLGAVLGIATLCLSIVLFLSL